MATYQKEINLLSRLNDLQIVSENRGPGGVTDHDHLKRSIALLTLSLVAGSAWGYQRIDRTIPAEPDGSLSVDNVSGTVRVEGWDRIEVQITGTIDDDVEELEIKSEGHRISISVELPDGRGWGRHDTSADLVIKAPRSTSLDVQTVSADIEITTMTGSLDIESVSGDVEISGETSEVEVESVSGEIVIRGACTRVQADSVSGNVDITGVEGLVEASTVSGDLDVKAGTLDRAELESVSGSVTFEGRFSPSARISAQSHSGTVALHVPEDVSARFEVSTFSGSIHNEFGAEATRTRSLRTGHGAGVHHRERRCPGLGRELQRHRADQEGPLDRSR